ncbi:MAG: helix-turn-helix domain-containing protein [Acidimicrobiales bacterium]|jgi:transcriptional regulator with XRE-family HTH domain|nr:helix-turn-helix domain-containing protein [Acidimicrobiales bacterium]
MAGEDPVREQLEALGEFIRSQRKQAQLSLRDLAERANVSNPYLSQIERGLHEPSVRVLKAIAGGLNLSVETLLGRAGLLGSPTDPDEGPTATEHAILADPYLGDDQRASLLAVYRSYVDRVRQPRPAEDEPAP